MTDTADYFSKTTTEADQKFEAACLQADAALERYHHPLPGPEGERLQTMVCRLGREDADNILFLNSGTHGVEGYVGAGAQVGALTEQADVLPLDSNSAVVMTHLINPWGTAWLRYVNEDNIDLMKGLTYGENPPPSDPLFDEIDDALQIESLTDESKLQEALERRAALNNAYSEDRIMAALKPGQISRPKSIVYNGELETWSHKTLYDVAARYLRNARRVIFLDLHSGVGDWGEAYLMASGDAQSQQRVKTWFGERAHDHGLSIDRPHYSTLAEIAPEAELTVAVMEGGTAEFGEDFRRLMRSGFLAHLRSFKGCDEPKSS